MTYVVTGVDDDILDRRIFFAAFDGADGRYISCARSFQFCATASKRGELPAVFSKWNSASFRKTRPVLLFSFYVYLYCRMPPSQNHENS